MLFTDPALPAPSLYLESNAMKCSELALEIEKLPLSCTTQQVAAMCLVLANTFDDLDERKADGLLLNAIGNAGMKLSSGLDQYSAVTKEVGGLVATPPETPTEDEFLRLVRGFKVSTQTLSIFMPKT